MTKIYLLNPPYLPHFGRGMRWQDSGRAGTLYYPIWLAYATGSLEQAGFAARLVDAPAQDWDRKQVLDDIKAFQPGMVVVDSSFPSLNNDIQVAAGIKEALNDVLVVMVGPPASQMTEGILQSGGVDVVARWEYDFTLVKVAEAAAQKAKLAEIKGISYKEKGKIVHNPDREFSDSRDLDTLPFVADVYKRHLNIRHYFLGNSLYPEVQIFTGRGCPFQCTFCSWPQTLMGRKYRVRSIGNILDEVQWVQDNLPQVREIFFEDDTFTIDNDRVRGFCQEYSRRGLRIPWAVNARVGLDYDTMKAMKKANCRLLIVGYESGSDEILQRIKKGITVAESRRFARDARKAGLLVLGDFVIGLPGETKETIALTRGLIKETRPDLLQVSVASPFPGTEFYEWAREKGYLLTQDPNEYLDRHGHQKSVIAYPSLSAEEMVLAVDDILKRYYLSPGYIPLALRQVWRKNGWSEAQRIGKNAQGFLKYIFSRDKK